MSAKATHSTKGSIVLCLLLCFPLFGRAGGTVVADRIDQVSLLVDQHLYVAAMEKADSLLQNSDLSADERGKLHVLKGKTLKAKQKPVQAIQQFNKVLELRLPKDALVRAEALASLGEIYDTEKSLDMARDHYNAALKIYSLRKYAPGEADIFGKLGLLDKREKKWEQSLDNLELAKDIYTALDNPLQQAYMAESMGLIDYSLGEYDRAENAFLEATTIYEQNDFLHSQDYLIQYLTAIYQMREDYDRAIQFTQKAIEGSSIMRDSLKASKNYRQMAIFQEKKGEDREAIKAQMRALDWVPDGQFEREADYLLKLAKLYNKNGRSADASLAFFDAYTKAQDARNLSQMIDISQATTFFYQQQQDWEQSSSFTALTDSLQELRVAKIKAFYEEQLTSAPGEKVVENDLPLFIPKVASLHKWKVGLAMAVALILLMLFWLIRTHKRNQRLNQVLEWKVIKRTKELHNSNQELNTYIYRSSHDLRNPLTSIKSLLALLNSQVHSKETQQYLNMISESTQRMDDILIKLSRAVDYKKIKIQPRQVDFLKVKNELLEGDLSDLNGLKLLWHIEESAPFFSDVSLLKVILQKTIDNSVQYRKGTAEDYCKVIVTTDRNGATVSIKDNGMGIPSKVRNNVFDMFVKGTHRSQGAGLGLYLVWIVTERIKGRIKLDTEEKQGCTLTFRLPNLTP